jgi:hypothetical protein
MRDNSKANALLSDDRWGKILAPRAAAAFSGCTSVAEFRSLYSSLIYITHDRERIDKDELEAILIAEKNAARAGKMSSVKD